MLEIIDQSTVQHIASEQAAILPDCSSRSAGYTHALATDCACAGAYPFLSTGNLRQWSAEQELTVPARLHCEPIGGTHWALFDPDGDGGVVVVNQATHDFLWSFRGGQTSRQAGSGHDPMSARRATQRLVELGMLIPVGEQTAAEPPRRHALSAWMHVTNECNMSCAYCYIQKTSQTMHEATAQRAVEAIMRSALQHGYQEVRLKYAGGEPTLRMQQVLTLHDYAAAKLAQAGLDFSATLLSNGSLLSLRSIEEIQRRRIQVMISLDGLGSEHDVQRPLRNNKPSSACVQAGIERLLQAGVRPHISITLTAHNCDNAAEVAAFALAHDCTFALNLYRASPSIANPEKLQLESQAVIKAFERVYQLLERNVPEWSVLGAMLDRGHLLAPHEHAACGVGRDYMVIDHQGRVAKCQMTIDDTITDVADPDPLETIRLSPKGVRNPAAAEKEGCRTCTWQRWCAGGCPLVTYGATGRYDVKSPYCDIYQALYPMAIHAEGMRLLRYGHSSLMQ